jgi:hypothetical protein
MLKWEDLSELEQLATTYSDFHKDMYGFRPRHGAEWTVEDYKKAMAEMHASIDRQQETFAGREQLREDGWCAEETDPELQKRAVWLAEERDRFKQERYGDYWDPARDAEAPRMRKRWNME